MVPPFTLAATVLPLCFLNSRGRLGPAKSDGSRKVRGKAGEMKTERAGERL